MSVNILGSWAFAEMSCQLFSVLQYSFVDLLVSGLSLLHLYNAFLHVLCNIFLSHFCVCKYRNWKEKTLWIVPLPALTSPPLQCSWKVGHEQEVRTILITGIQEFWGGRGQKWALENNLRVLTTHLCFETLRMGVLSVEKVNEDLEVLVAEVSKLTAIVRGLGVGFVPSVTCSVL